MIFFVINKFYYIGDNNIGGCMIIRLGYVAISNAISDTSSSLYTYSEYINTLCPSLLGVRNYNQNKLH